MQWRYNIFCHCRLNRLNYYDLSCCFPILACRKIWCCFKSGSESHRFQWQKLWLSVAKLLNLDLMIVVWSICYCWLMHTCMAELVTVECHNQFIAGFSSCSFTLFIYCYHDYTVYLLLLCVIYSIQIDSEDFQVPIPNSTHKVSFQFLILIWTHYYDVQDTTINVIIMHVSM